MKNSVSQSREQWSNRVTHGLVRVNLSGV
jgi:hypothetical protein